MKRIVVLIDGTWDKEGITRNTNVARLDRLRQAADFIKPKAADGTIQQVYYHAGVGTEGELIQRILGGVVGLGLKQIIREAYEHVVRHYESGDELYFWGFSRGAYAARALAGLIGASGIQRRIDDELFEVAWRHYRVRPTARRHPNKASGREQQVISRYDLLAGQDSFHETRAIKCIAVWDTVGSYGVPAHIWVGGARAIFHTSDARLSRHKLRQPR